MLDFKIQQPQGTGNGQFLCFKFTIFPYISWIAWKYFELCNCTDTYQLFTHSFSCQWWFFTFQSILNNRYYTGDYCLLLFIFTSVSVHELLNFNWVAYWKYHHLRLCSSFLRLQQIFSSCWFLCIWSHHHCSLDTSLVQKSNNFGILDLSIYELFLKKILFLLYVFRNHVQIFLDS
jgi:hypothetical protein